MLNFIKQKHWNDKKINGCWIVMWKKEKMTWNVKSWGGRCWICFCIVYSLRHKKFGRSNIAGQLKVLLSLLNIRKNLVFVVNANFSANLTKISFLLKILRICHMYMRFLFCKSMYFTKDWPTVYRRLISSLEC